MKTGMPFSLIVLLFMCIGAVNLSFAQSADSAKYKYLYDTIPHIPGITKTYQPGMTQATLAPEGQTLTINEFMASNGNVFEDEFGEYDDWIEIFNFGDQPVDINGIYITDEITDPEKWRFFSGSGPLYLAPGEYYLFWADGQHDQGVNHLGFKLSAEGEEIAIFTSTDQLLIDSVTYSQQYYDVSKGRQPDGGETWNFFLTPTPGASNSTDGFLGQLSKPQFSNSGGFFNTPFQLNITNSNPGSVTRYTLDGSIPTESSPVFNDLSVGSTMTFRARSFQTGYLPGNIATHTYLFDPIESLDVISLVTNSSALWGENGILTARYSGLEKPISIEYLKNNGSQGFSIDAGIKIHAPDGRPQQSFRLSMRRMYRQDEIEYPVFPDKDILSYKRLILRNAGNDGSQLVTQRTHFRDPLMHVISSENGSEVGTSAYKPVHVYLNGNYWGIYNLRERIDKYYIQAYYGTQNIDLLERSFGYYMNQNAIEGDWINFTLMKNFADTADLQEPQNYVYMKTLMDIHNFSEYWIYVVYYGNFDWLSNNMKFWRTRDTSGRWRWIHWDLDHGLGLPYFDYSHPVWNTLEWSTSLESGRPWEGYNTILIRNLLENEDFRIQFINRFADLLNTSFKPDNLVPVVDSLALALENDLPRHFERWGNTLENWQDAVDGVRNYINNRPGYVWQHLMNKFGLEQPNELILDVSPANSGKIEVNYITVNQFPWNGKYFEEIPVSIKATPYEGYEFYGWNGNDTTLAEMTITLDADSQYTAFFAVSTGERDILINEINYNSSQNFQARDWVELYNPNPWRISLTGYTLKDSDEDHIFLFQGNSKVSPFDYYVLSQDTVSLVALFPDLTALTGNFEFGFSSEGEYIRLYDETGTLIDSVYYYTSYPWPLQPNGTGVTLELMNHNPDNDLPDNWQASYVTGGTPGLPNSVPGTSISGLSDPKPILSVYPNPGIGLYYLSFSESLRQPFEVKVFDIMGHRISTLKGLVSGTNETIRIDLQDQPDGMYIISVLFNAKVEKIRVIKSSGY